MSFILEMFAIWSPFKRLSNMKRVKKLWDLRPYSRIFTLYGICHLIPDLPRTSKFFVQCRRNLLLLRNLRLLRNLLLLRCNDNVTVSLPTQNSAFSDRKVCRYINSISYKSRLICADGRASLIALMGGD